MVADLCIIFVQALISVVFLADLQVCMNSMTGHTKVMSLPVSSCLAATIVAMFHWHDYACPFVANCKSVLVKVSISCIMFACQIPIERCDACIET